MKHYTGCGRRPAVVAVTFGDCGKPRRVVSGSRKPSWHWSQCIPNPKQERHPIVPTFRICILVYITVLCFGCQRDVMKTWLVSRCTGQSCQQTGTQYWVRNEVSKLNSWYDSIWHRIFTTCALFQAGVTHVVCLLLHSTALSVTTHDKLTN